MTIHRAKGLEFDLVAVADLGREPRRRSEILRVGAGGRIGLRLACPGTGRALPALDYLALGQERQRAEAAEERRIFYVAMTRARERLILSGAARLDEHGGLAPGPQSGIGPPIAWITPALAKAGIQPVIVREKEPPATEEEPSTPDRVPTGPGVGPPRGAPVQAPPALSYSALTEYRRCAYRFYLERVLGVPPVAARVAGEGGARARDPRARATRAARLSPPDDSE